MEGLKNAMAQLFVSLVSVMRIEVTRAVLLAPIIITIQRLDEHQHCHILGQSRDMVPSMLATRLATAGAEKGYAPVQSLNALRHWDTRGFQTPYRSKW